MKHASQTLELRPDQAAEGRTFTLARVIVWRDIRWAIVWGGPDEHGLESSDTWMNFTLHPIFGFTGGEDPIYDECSVGGPANTFATDVTKATPAFRGFIKWDGCMQWRSDGHLFHVDGHDDLDRLIEALRRVRDLMRLIDPEVEARPK